MTMLEGRLLNAELLEHATQRKFVYRHDWRAGNYVMWDNRSTLHHRRRYGVQRRRNAIATPERLAA